MSVKALEAKLEVAERDACLPKVVIPVHLCGASCDMASIAVLADRYGFTVLEDASHAIGGSYQGEPVGSCSYSAISVFSFHPVKIITTAEGGLATTNDPHLAQRMTDLRSHGITKEKSRFDYPAPGPWSYEQYALGFNYRMTDVQAALGLSQLRRLDQIVKERNFQLKLYMELLAHLPVQLLEISADVLSSVHLAVIRLADPARSSSRIRGLRAAGIGVQLTTAGSPSLLRAFGFQEGDFPEAEAYATNAISLPLFPGLLIEDQQRVVRTLESLLAS